MNYTYFAYITKIEGLIIFLLSALAALTGFEFIHYINPYCDPWIFYHLVLS